MNVNEFLSFTVYNTHAYAWAWILMKIWDFGMSVWCIDVASSWQQILSIYLFILIWIKTTWLRIVSISKIKSKETRLKTAWLLHWLMSHTQKENVTMIWQYDVDVVFTIAHYQVFFCDVHRQNHRNIKHWQILLALNSMRVWVWAGVCVRVWKGQ